MCIRVPPTLFCSESEKLLEKLRCPPLCTIRVRSCRLLPSGCHPLHGTSCCGTVCNKLYSRQNFTTTSVRKVLGNRSTRPPSRGWIGSWGVIRSPVVGLQDIVSDGPTHRLPMENRPCKHGSLNATIPPVSDGVHARMRPTSGLLVLALAS